MLTKARALSESRDGSSAPPPIYAAYPLRAAMIHATDFAITVSRQLSMGKG